jgi:hypothetical protein
MSTGGRNLAAKALVFATIAEMATGVVAIVDPALLVVLLLGVELPGAGIAVARCFGIALVALALACWPPREPGAAGQAVRAMLFYNCSIATFLGWLGAGAHMTGMLLWPAVVLHAIVALALAASPSGRAMENGHNLTP